MIVRIVIDLQSCQTPTSRNRGMGRYSLELARAIARYRGDHEVWLAVNGRFGESIPRIRAAFDALIPDDHIIEFTVPAHSTGNARTMAWRERAAELIRQKVLAAIKPDVVHFSSMFEGFTDDAVTSVEHARHSTTATLYDLIPLVQETLYLADPAGRQWYLDKVAHLKRCTLLLAISEHSRLEATSLLVVPEQRIVNISAAVDNQRFKALDFSPSYATELRARYGLTRPFLMYTGGCDVRKNIHGLIDAFAQLSQSLRSQYQLAIVCQLPDATCHALQRRATAAGLSSDQLIITGFIPDDALIALYNLCHLFVYPSLHEGFGLPALEAMACGAPVIGSGTSSIPEVIGRTDALFDPAKPAAITQAITRVLTDEAYRLDLREHGLRRARHFSWQHSAKRAIEAFEQINDQRSFIPRTSSSPSNADAVVANQALMGLFSELQVGLAETEYQLGTALRRLEQSEQQYQGRLGAAAIHAAQLLRRLGERERQLERVFRSASWKLTSPLRRVRRKIQRYFSRPTAISRGAAIAKLPRACIFIECTHTYHSALNTGIQRVVRNVIRNAPDIGRQYGVQIIPVILQDGQYQVADPAYVLRNPERVVDAPHWYSRFILLIAQAGDACRRAVFGRSSPPLKHLNQVLNHRHNILLLLDASWTTSFWDAADRFKQAGGTVVGVIYDLIPITHPHTSVPELTTSFAAWLSRNIETSDGFITISRFTKDQLQIYARDQNHARWANPGAPIEHFYLGSELDFATRSYSPASNRIKPLFATATPTILMVGSIEPRKMHGYVLDAFDRLWQTGMPIRLMIIGRQAWNSAALLDRIEHHPKRDNELFLLRDISDDELEFCYHNATALVIASEIEGFGLPLVEALQRGLPVLCSDIPVFREIAGDNAIFFKLDDPNYLVEAIRRPVGRHNRDQVKWLTWRDSTQQLFLALDKLTGVLQLNSVKSVSR